MTHADEPGYAITTQDQATNWLAELVAGVEEARRAVDIQPTADLTRKAHVTWLMRHGSALGALMALHRCGKLSDVAYNLFNQRVKETLVPTIIAGGSK